MDDETLPPEALPRCDGEVWLSCAEGLFRVVPDDDGEWSLEPVVTN